MEPFYDSSIHTGTPVNVTIQSEEKKTVLGASLTVTYGNDSLRHNEWNQATGMFIGSSEVFKNVTNSDGWYIEALTVTTQAITTNMWSSRILGLYPKGFYALVAVCVMLAVLLSVIVVGRRRGINRLTLHIPLQ